MNGPCARAVRDVRCNLSVQISRASTNKRPKKIKHKEMKNVEKKIYYTAAHTWRQFVPTTKNNYTIVWLLFNIYLNEPLCFNGKIINGLRSRLSRFALLLVLWMQKTKTGLNSYDRPLGRPSTGWNNARCPIRYRGIALGARWSKRLRR